MPSRFDFGPLSVLAAQTFGEPGNRTFRVVTSDGRYTVAIWMEKEQLKALADAIDELLVRMRGSEEEAAAGTGLSEAPPLPEPDPVPDPDAEFQVGQLSLGFDRELDLFVLLAWDIEEVEEEEPTLAGRATRDQLRTLSQRIGEIYVAGRPRCVLCGLPIEQGEHQCLRRNGHYKVTIE